MSNFGGDLRIFGATISSGGNYIGILNQPTTSEGAHVYETGLTANAIFDDTTRSWGKTYISTGNITGGVKNYAGALEIAGGTINGTWDAAVITDGLAITTIRGGIIQQTNSTSGSGAHTIWNASTGTTTISGGTITSKTGLATGDAYPYAVVNANTGTINITGGTISGIGTYGRGINNYGNGYVIVTGGTITTEGRYGNVIANGGTGKMKLENTTITSNYTSSSDNATEGITNGNYSGGSHAEMVISGTTTITVKDANAIYNRGGDLRMYGGTINCPGNTAIMNAPTTSEGKVVDASDVAAHSVITAAGRNWGRTYIRNGVVTGGGYGIYTTAGNYSVWVGNTADTLVNTISAPLVTGTSNAGVGGSSDYYVRLDNGVIRSYNRDEYAVSGGKSYVKTNRSGVTVTYKDAGSSAGYHYYYLAAS